MIDISKSLIAQDGSSPPIWPCSFLCLKQSVKSGVVVGPKGVGDSHLKKDGTRQLRPSNGGVGPAPGLSRTPGKTHEAKGPKGANTEEILLDLGYSDPQIRTFFKAHVIE